MSLFMIKKDEFKNISKIFLRSRVIYWLIFILSAMMLEGFKESVLHFDVEHYISIGLKGYAYEEQYAFFPMLPLIIAFFRLFKLTLKGTLVFNFIISYITTILIYKIVKEIYLYDEIKVMNIIRFWCYSPIALFTMIPYTEGIFIFLTALTYYLYKTGKSPVFTGIALGLSVFTRNTGALLFFALFIVLFIDLIKNYKYKFKEKCIYILKLYIPATLISCIYPTYLYLKKGDFFYFINIQFTKWDRVKSNIFTMILGDIEVISRMDEISSIIAFFNLVLLLSALFFVGYLTHKSVKNKEPDYLLFFLYVAFSCISFFSTMRFDGFTTPSCSIYRYLYSLFPLYLYKKEHILSEVSHKVFIVLNLIIILAFVMNLFLC